MKIIATAKNRMGDDYVIVKEKLNLSGLKVSAEGVVSFKATFGPYSNNTESKHEYTGTIEMSLLELREILATAEILQTNAISNLTKELRVLSAKIVFLEHQITKPNSPLRSLPLDHASRAQIPPKGDR